MNYFTSTKKKLLSKVIQAIVVTGAIGASILANASTAAAHGYVEAPASRAYTAVLLRDKPSWNWSTIHEKYGAAVNEPQSIEGPGSAIDSLDPHWWDTNRAPDGQLASGGLVGGTSSGLDFSPLDVQKEGYWKTQDLLPGVNEFTWYFTMGHATNQFKYFITKEGWDPNSPITNDDLELLEDINLYGEVLGHHGTRRTHEIIIPADRTGYHVVLAVWDIADTEAAFYQAIDVNIVNDQIEWPPQIEVKEKRTVADFFPDENLAQRIAQLFNRTPADNITIEELNDFTTFIALRDHGIRNLEGLQYLTGITALTLEGHSISNFEPLANLTQLQELSIRNNQIKISDLSPLGNLTNLKWLHLTNNQINDLSGLEKLANNFGLSLSLSDNEISDLEPLRNFRSLSNLFLNNNQINNVEPLRNARISSNLHLNDNQILDVAPLRNHTCFITAANQSITLDSIIEGQVTTGIFILHVNGFAPSGLSHVYDSELGSITWNNLGKNSLSWFDNITFGPLNRNMTFSGTIYQNVIPEKPDPEETDRFPEWDAFASYSAGDRVSYEGQIWEALVTFHGYGDTSWAPGPDSTLWRLVNYNILLTFFLN